MSKPILLLNWWAPTINAIIPRQEQKQQTQHHYVNACVWSLGW